MNLRKSSRKKRRAGEGAAEKEVGEAPEEAEEGEVDDQEDLVRERTIGRFYPMCVSHPTSRSTF